MKVLLVNGGGRPDGVTSYLCAEVSDSLRARGSDVTVLELSKHSICFCTGCGRCEETGSCHLDDGAGEMTAAFMSSDLVVFATSVRFSGPTALLKRYMERFQPYWYGGNRRKGGRMTAMICGGSERPDFNNVSRELRAFSITMGREWSDPLEISGTDTADPISYREECSVWLVNLIRDVCPDRP